MANEDMLQHQKAYQDASYKEYCANNPGITQQRYDVEIAYRYAYRAGFVKAMELAETTQKSTPEPQNTVVNVTINTPDDPKKSISVDNGQNHMPGNYEQLRAQAAIAAMQGILGNDDSQCIAMQGDNPTEPPRQYPEGIAKYAVACANALLAELDKTKDNEN